MLLILEIALTIAAWRKGWGARALLPLVFGFGAAFLIGLVIGAAGGSTDGAAVFGILCDVGVVIALGIMARRAPQAGAAHGPAESLEQAGEPGELQLHLNH
ncbi:MAG: hypothetical protein ACLQG3_04925 [Terracidiphilus sp.]